MKYQGGFKGGEYDGYGNLVDERTVTYTGDFKEGKFDGKGESIEYRF